VDSKNSQNTSETQTGACSLNGVNGESRMNGKSEVNGEIGVKGDSRLNGVSAESRVMADGVSGLNVHTVVSGLNGMKDGGTP
jgi:hypothetical protein